MDKVLALAACLGDANIDFTTAIVRPDAVMFQIRVPGEYWEVEIFSDGRTEFERFTSTGQISDEVTLMELLDAHAD